MKLSYVLSVSVLALSRIGAQSSVDSLLVPTRAGVVSRYGGVLAGEAPAFGDAAQRFRASVQIAATTGRANHTRVGVFIGAAVGASIMLAMGWNAAVESGASNRPPSPVEKAGIRLGLGVIGGAVGGFLGGAVGALIRAEGPAERGVTQAPDR